MAWIQLPSVSVNNGSRLVTVPGGHDLANVESGWSFDVGPTRAEIQSVSAQDGSGVRTITLVRDWDGSNVNAQPAQIVPIAGGELYVIKQLQDANDYAVQTHAAMRDYGTKDADITLTQPGGEPVQFSSLPKQDRLAIEQRTENQQLFSAQLQQQQSDVNDLLSNKTAEMDSAIESLNETLSNSESIIDQNLEESAQNAADAISAYEQQLSASINAIDTTFVSSRSAINASLSAYEQAAADLISSSESTAAASIQAQQDIAASIAESHSAISSSVAQYKATAESLIANAESSFADSLTQSTQDVQASITQYETTASSLITSAETSVGDSLAQSTQDIAAMIAKAESDVYAVFPSLQSSVLSAMSSIVDIHATLTRQASQNLKINEKLQKLGV